MLNYLKDVLFNFNSEYWIEKNHLKYSLWFFFHVQLPLNYLIQSSALLNQ